MIYLGIVAGIFLLEFIIKGQIEKKIGIHQKIKIWKGKIHLRKFHNKGLALNFLEKKQGLVAGISLGLTILGFLYFLTILPRKGQILLKVGMSLLLGGAFSNVYDRVKRKYVVDYFSFSITKGKWKDLSNIVFNQADFFIFLGSLLVLISSFFTNKE